MQPLDTIVLGMDFSQLAIATAEWLAVSLAPAARLILVHAIESPPRPPYPIAETLPESVLAADARAHAEDELAEASRLIGRNVAKGQVRIGTAADVLIEAAAEERADMIAVGPHGNRRHESLLLGTSADNIVRSARTPVLVGARAPLRGRSDVIAAVTDGPASHAVLAWAELASRPLAGRLTVLHAIEPAAYTHMASLAAAHSHGDAAVERAEVNGELRWQASRWLRETASLGFDTAHVEPVVEEGVADEVITRTAAQERSALIVVGRHENTRGLPAVLGRTVRHVLHEARCAVLVVPEP